MVCKKIGLHIDITQRGRKKYKHAQTEAELIPLREEFATMIRTARKDTRCSLRVASTITVTRQNLPEIPMLVKWYLDNADAFRLASFLPAAQVGRTENGMGGSVTQEDVWAGIEEGLGGMKLEDAQWWYGDPRCSHWVMGAVVSRRGSVRYFPASMTGSDKDARFMEKFFHRFARITFRADSLRERGARVLGMFLRHPWFMGVDVPRYVWHWMKRIGPAYVVLQLLKMTSGRTDVRRLTFGTHHFMSPVEAMSADGQERIKACVFKVPMNGKMVSMCEFNALGGRDKFYQSIAEKPKNREVQFV